MRYSTGLSYINRARLLPGEIPVSAPINPSSNSILFEMKTTRKFPSSDEKSCADSRGLFSPSEVKKNPFFSRSWDKELKNAIGLPENERYSTRISAWSTPIAESRISLLSNLPSNPRVASFHYEGCATGTSGLHTVPSFGSCFLVKRSFAMRSTHR